MLTGSKLLLADDSITIQKVVDLTFTDEGMKVTTVSDGDQVLKRLEEEAPDIVLADVFMPGRSGYQVCEHIKGDKRFNHIPVMLLVGAFEPFNEAEARRVGADGFLTKPFQSIRGLVNKVGSLLNSRTNEETNAQDEAASQESAPRSLEHSTADLFEPQHRADESSSLPQAVEAEPSAERLVTHNTESFGKEAFADEAMDDEMIKATSAQEFGIQIPSRPTAPLVAAKVIGNSQANPAREADEELSKSDAPDLSSLFSESDDLLEQAPYATHVINAADADDALLDLGDAQPLPAAAEADDFILDLADETPVPQAQVAKAASASVAVYGEEPFILPPSVSALASTPPTAVTTEGSMARAATESDDTAPSGGSAQNAVTRQVDPEQLSPEIIDSIARRVVEQLSEKVVREIAWEVVPQLAELMIKRRLEEEDKLKSQ